jgi:hypothetical protein
MITEGRFLDDGTCVVPKHDEDLVTSDKHILFM